LRHEVQDRRRPDRVAAQLEEGGERKRQDHRQSDGRQRHRPLDEAGADAFKGEDADRIAADAEIGGVAKTHHAAIAHDEIEAGGGKRKDDDAGEQRQDEDVAGQRGIDRQ
jgi:hypothetical protein